MWFTTLRILIAGIMLLTAVLINRRRRWNPKRYYLIVSGLILAVQIVLTVLPYDVFTVRFSTPENAYVYNHSAQVDCVIEGSEVCLVIGDKHGDYSNAIITRDERGWIASSSRLMPRFFQTTGAFVEIYYDKNSGDCFIIVVDMSSADTWNVAFSDNRDSNFVHWQDPPVAAAYIGTLETPYEMVINGTALTITRGAQGAIQVGKTG